MVELIASFFHKSKIVLLFPICKLFAFFRINGQSKEVKFRVICPSIRKRTEDSYTFLTCLWKKE